MALMQEPFRKAFSTAISHVLGQWGVEPPVANAKVIYDLCTLPPNPALGHVAYPCFSISKLLKKSPQTIAQEVVEALKTLVAQPPPLLGMVVKWEAVGPYVNGFLNTDLYMSHLWKRAQEKSLFSQRLLESSEVRKISVEYSQPNTHKALHVGHLRCLVLGDAVCRILAFVGHDVVRATYPGDMGLHVAKTLWYITHHHKGPLPSHDRAVWLGEVYAKADTLYKETVESDGGVTKQQISQIFSQLKSRSGPIWDLWTTTREWSLQEMASIYEWLGVSFDQWFFESECDAPSVALVKQKLEEGFFTKSDGAVGIDLSPYKLGFALFLKSDGNGLYLTKDLELIRQKFSDPQVQQSIVVVDSRQKLHFQQLFKTAELMGYKQASQSIHLPYETVNGADGAALSSRALNGMQLRDFKRHVEQKVVDTYLERYRGQWTDAEILKTAEQVAIGALKYGMLRVDNNTQVTFVLEDWLRLDGDTGPYLQYVFARCSTILEKLGQPPPTLPTQDMVLTQGVEQELVAHLARFNDTALQAAHQLRPALVASYLFDLAKLFNRFYEHCPIKGAVPATANYRLAMVAIVAATMGEGLNLLGIPAPSKM